MSSNVKIRIYDDSQDSSFFATFSLNERTLLGDGSDDEYTWYGRIGTATLTRTFSEDVEVTMGVVFTGVATSGKTPWYATTLYGTVKANEASCDLRCSDGFNEIFTGTEQIGNSDYRHAIIRLSGNRSAATVTSESGFYASFDPDNVDPTGVTGYTSITDKDGNSCTFYNISGSPYLVYGLQPTFVSGSIVKPNEYLIEGDAVTLVSAVKPIYDGAGTPALVWNWTTTTKRYDGETVPSDAATIGGKALSTEAVTVTSTDIIPNITNGESGSYKNFAVAKTNVARCSWVVPRSEYPSGYGLANLTTGFETYKYHEYSKPKAISASVTRCNVSGAADNEGTCAAIDLTYIADALAGADSTDRPNPCSVVVTATSGDETHTQTFDLGNATGDSTTEQLIFNAAELAASNAYSVSVELTDSVGSTATVNSTLSKSFFLMDFDGSTGKSIGIGQEAASSDVPDNGRLDISMDTNLHAPVTMDSTLTVGGAISAPYLVGSIQMYGGATAPTGWLLCDGSAVSRTTYSKLFEVLGTAYGEGDGSTTFNVPNLQNKFALGSSSGKALGATGGEETHTLTTAEMPSHSHSAADGWHFYRINASGVNVGKTTIPIGNRTNYTNIQWSDSAVGWQHDTTSTGSSGSHNNMPPYQVVNYIVYCG